MGLLDALGRRGLPNPKDQGRLLPGHGILESPLVELGADAHIEELGEDVLPRAVVGGGAPPGPAATRFRLVLPPPGGPPGLLLLLEGGQPGLLPPLGLPSSPPTSSHAETRAPS